jgi:hypothetical protein
MSIAAAQEISLSALSLLLSFLCGIGYFIYKTFFWSVFSVSNRQELLALLVQWSSAWGILNLWGYVKMSYGVCKNWKEIYYFAINIE